MRYFYKIILFTFALLLGCIYGQIVYGAETAFVTQGSQSNTWYGASGGTDTWSHMLQSFTTGATTTNISRLKFKFSLASEANRDAYCGGATGFNWSICRGDGYFIANNESAHTTYHDFGAPCEGNEPVYSGITSFSSLGYTGPGDYSLTPLDFIAVDESTQYYIEFEWYTDTVDSSHYCMALGYKTLNPYAGGAMWESEATDLYMVLYSDNDYEPYEPESPTENFQFMFPEEGSSWGNSEWLYYNVYYDLASDDVAGMDLLFLRIQSSDSKLTYIITTDYPTFTVNPTSWEVLHPAFADGLVNLSAELWGASSTATCYQNYIDGCEWSVLGSDTVSFFATSTRPHEDWLTGFIPTSSTSPARYVLGMGATTTARDLACTEQEWASSTDDITMYVFCKAKEMFYSVFMEISGKSSDAINNSMGQLAQVFPFNLAVKTYDCWNASESEPLPSSLTFMAMASDGIISVDMPDEWVASTTFTLYSTTTFAQTTGQQTFFSNIRAASMYLMYLIFIIGIFYRGKSLIASFNV